LSQEWQIDTIDSTSTSPATDISKLVGGHNANRSNFSGASSPSETTAYQVWADTTNGVVKRRNAADDGWEIIASLNETPVQEITSDYTATLTDYDGLLLVDASSGDVTITLPTVASAGNGWRIAVKKTDASSNSVIVASLSLIDGSSTAEIIEENGAEGYRTDGSTYSIDASKSSIAMSGNLVLLQEHDVVAETEQEMTGDIDDTYDTYVVRCTLTFSATSLLVLQASINNGTTYLAGTNYRYAFVQTTSGALFIARGATGASSMPVGDSAGTLMASSDEYLVSNIEFRNLRNTSANKNIFIKTNYLGADSIFYSVDGSGGVTTTSAVNALRMQISTGTMTGTIQLFGVQK